LGGRSFATKKIEILLSEGDRIRFGGSYLDVIETPGHSEGGISFYTHGYLFCGDTLFRESIGRTDLYGGDFNILIQSIKKLYLLNDETAVYPGHGPATTIEHEKKHNFYVNE
jgi:glyoxylase-like metal-dependent hydrolase (beta-lactamase superfamily II)